MNETVTTAGQGGRPGASEKVVNILIRLLVYSSALYFFSFVTADTDLWGHIRFGESLWAQKALQRVDIYSYTAFGSQWINHEWLSELVMYFVYHVFGSPGLLIGKLLVGFLIVYLLSSISLHRPCEPWAYGTIFVLSVFVMCPGFMIRPQLLTFLFTAAFLYIFHLYLDRGKNLLWSLPVIMVAWVNSHGGFLIGAGLFPVVVVAEYINCRVRSRDTGHIRAMVFWLILTETAVFINPYGCHLPGFLFRSLNIPRDISEWSPVTVFDLSYLRFKLLALLFLWSFFIKNRERRYWEAGVIIVAMLYAFMHQRHTPIFAMAAAPYLTENFSLLVQRMGFLGRIRSLASHVLLGAFLFILISYQVAFAGSKYIKAGWNIIVDPSVYPVHAVRFLKQNGIRGDVLVPFEWGEYVIWKLYPECRVSIDGRFRTVYPEAVLRAHFGAGKDVSRLKDLLDRYPADIILGRQNPVYHKLISAQNEWIYVYSDPTAIVFVRNSDSQKGFLEKFWNKRLIYPEAESKSLLYFP